MTTQQKTWSQRFESALHPAIARFNASIGFDIELIEYDLTGSVAHAKMLAKTGIISAAEGEQLVNGLEQIRSEYRQGLFVPGVDAEDVHFAVEKRLTDIVGDAGKKLHTARSRNDQPVLILGCICAIASQKYDRNCGNFKGFCSTLPIVTWKL